MRLFIIATVVFLSASACHSRSADDVLIAGETIATDENAETEDPVLAEQRRLASELAALEKRETILKQRLGDHKDFIAESDNRVKSLKNDLRQKKAATNAYIDQHELPVACAYARQVARGEGEYSEKTRRCAEIASMYCAVAMISPRFRRKVATVKQRVDEATAEAQSLNEQIASEEKKLQAERADLHSTQESIDRIAGDIAALRRTMSAPDHSTISPHNPTTLPSASPSTTRNSTNPIVAPLSDSAVTRQRPGMTFCFKV